MSKKDVFDRVNDLVIEGLKKDGLQWFKPWKGGSENAPFNLSTNRYYNGFNIFMLNCEMRLRGYQYNQWLTSKQVKAMGGTIVDGESEKTEVYFWKIGYYDRKTRQFVPDKDVKKIRKNEKLDDGKDRYRKTFSVRFYKVFNVDQCEGITPKQSDKVITDVVNDPVEVADDLVNSYVSRQNGFKIVHNGNSAYYSPSADYVNMPKLETFVDSDSYYKVLFHELAHSTGHKSRLNRKSLTEIVKWGDATYAKEELVAEISCMYICGLLGLSPQDDITNSQAYIKGWCKYLTDKPKECIYAMQMASKVVAYIQG